MIYRRATFLRMSGTQADPTKKHLHVVLTDSFGRASQVLVTSIASIRTKKFDNTRLLEPNEHEFIRRHSYVFYRETSLLGVQRIEACLESKEYAQKEDISEELYYRIASGVFESRQCPKFAKKVLQDLGLPK